jgi:hypothetical protein
VLALTANNSPTSVVKAFTEQLPSLDAQRTATQHYEQLAIVCREATSTAANAQRRTGNEKYYSRRATLSREIAILFPVRSAPNSQWNARLMHVHISCVTVSCRTENTPHHVPHPLFSVYTALRRFPRPYDVYKQPRDNPQRNAGTQHCK